MQKKIIKRGDIYYATLDPTIGSEQSGDRRPVIVVQNDVGNEYSSTVIVLPITSNIIKNPLPTHVILPKSCGLEEKSLVLAEQIRTIDRSRLLDYIGYINDEFQSKVDKALTICVGLENRHSKGKIFILNLCSRCESDFRNNGYLLVKRGWQKEKMTCDFCQASQGWLFGILN